MSYRRIAALCCLALAPAFAQLKPKDVRAMGKEGTSALPRLQELLKDGDPEIRVAATQAVGEVGTAQCIDPLLMALADNHPDVQVRATDELVNFYLPGYIQSGLAGRLKSVGRAIPWRSPAENDQVIEPYVQVRAEVIQALGKTARGGSSMASRANAARAVGILLGRAAIPDLLEALRSKDTGVIYECLIAIQKIQDRSTAPRIRYLLNDFEERVQIAAVEATGLLRAQESAPDLVQLFGRTTNSRVRKAVLLALARIPDANSRSLFQRHLEDRDEDLRAAAAEGLGRLRKAEDLPILEKAFQNESKLTTRLSMAFALVLLGKREISEFSPFQTLVNALNNRARQGEAFALLVELARDEAIRQSLYPAIAQGTKDEKIYLARVLGRSGGADSVKPLDQLMEDRDADVAQEALRASRSVKTRL